MVVDHTPMNSSPQATVKVTDGSQMHIFYGDHSGSSRLPPMPLEGRKPQGLEDRRLENEEIQERESWSR
jgi:hypothetical protein